MKRQDVLSSEFLQQFKTGEELNSFIIEIQKRSIEQLLEGELDAHLGYQKHHVSESKNARNGYNTKTIKTEQGAQEIQVPRD